MCGNFEKELSMKKKSLTVIRNDKVVGNNSKSYNDKHPENPVSLRPIHDACKATHKDDFKLRVKLRALASCSRPTMARGIARHMGANVEVTGASGAFAAKRPCGPQG